MGKNKPDKLGKNSPFPKQSERDRKENTKWGQYTNLCSMYATTKDLRNYKTYI